MWKKFAVCSILITMLASVGCQWQERAENIRNSKNLRVGMTKEQVVEVMGEPISDETYATPDIWFYYVDTKWYDGLTTEEECVPLIFNNGKLSGWGSEYYNQKRISGEYTE